MENNNEKPSLNVLAWRVVGPVDSGTGWVSAEDRKPPSIAEVYENGCRLDLLTGSGAAVAELVANVRQAVIEAEESPQTDADRLKDVSARLRAALAKFGGAV